MTPFVQRFQPDQLAAWEAEQAKRHVVHDGDQDDDEGEEGDELGEGEGGAHAIGAPGLQNKAVDETATR